MSLNNRHVLGICVFALSLNVSAQNTLVKESSIEVHSHQLHYYLIGSGSPTVVLEVGIGETYRDWLPFLEKIANRTRVFCYDRAGYGQSESGPMPRNCKREAEELRELLDKADITGPYIMVGHSLGASILQVFASQNETDVAGMLLLDPPPLDWISGKEFPQMTPLAEQTTHEFERLAETMGKSNNQADKNRENFFRTLASEHGEMFLSSAKELAAIKSFGEIPIIVIASGKVNPKMGNDAELFQDFWNDQCKQLASHSTNGKYVLAAESSHHIYIDNPEIVVNAINELLNIRE